MQNNQYQIGYPRPEDPVLAPGNNGIGIGQPIQNAQINNQRDPYNPRLVMQRSERIPAQMGGVTTMTIIRRENIDDISQNPTFL
mmetsp:Transcript_16990/g.18965  ORF Transcript_16990/g.18965 Transcript_16990/m.18965 type:complete len:84 (+) Transcript_16990:14-265(+)